MPKNKTIHGENEHNLVLGALKKYLFLPRNKIAFVTGISQQRLKKCLSEMISDQRIIAERYGAHFYYKADVSAIASLDSAFLDQAIDTLKVLPIEESPERQARTCYNHLAGVLGVRLLKSFFQASIDKQGNILHVYDMDVFNERLIML